MRAAQIKFIASLNCTESSELDSSKSEQDVSICDGNQVSEEPVPVVCSLCRDPDSKSPVSYLILLQKSQLASFVERGPPSWEEVPWSDKKHLSIAIRGMTDPSWVFRGLKDTKTPLYATVAGDVTPNSYIRQCLIMFCSRTDQL